MWLWCFGRRAAVQNLLCLHRTAPHYSQPVTQVGTQRQSTSTFTRRYLCREEKGQHFNSPTSTSLPTSSSFRPAQLRWMQTCPTDNWMACHLHSALHGTESTQTESSQHDSSGCPSDRPPSSAPFSGRNYIVCQMAHINVKASTTHTASSTPVGNDYVHNTGSEPPTAAVSGLRYCPSALDLTLSGMDPGPCKFSALTDASIHLSWATLADEIPHTSATVMQSKPFTTT